jgi:hypothetical protein
MNASLHLQISDTITNPFQAAALLKATLQLLHMKFVIRYVLESSKQGII